MNLRQLDVQELAATYLANYFELQQLTEQHAGSRRTHHKELLGKLLAFGRPNFADLDKTMVGELFGMALTLFRERWLGSATPIDGIEAEKRINWWCSFAAISQVGDAAAVFAARFLALGEFVTRQEATDLIAIEGATRADAAIWEWPLEAVETATRLEWVGLIHQLSQRDTTVNEEHQKVARQQCEALLLQGHDGDELRDIARGLGVHLPQHEIKADSAPGSVSESPNQPLIWQLPPNELDLQAPFQDCLFELLRILNIPDSPLSERTGGQVRAIRPDLSSGGFEEGFYFASQNLWSAFVRRGDANALELARRLLVFLYIASKSGTATTRRPAGYLHWWMNTHLPQLLRVADIKSLFEDAERVYALGLGRGDLTLSQGVIEALAGECRRLEAIGEAEERKSLLADHAEAVLDIYAHNRQRWRSNESIEEAVAYLETASGKAKSSPQSRAQIKSFAEHPDLKAALQGGAHGTVRAFIERHVDEIKELLTRRLQVRLAPEFMLKPAGEVYQREGESRRQVHPSFASAQRALNAGNFGQAAQVLERLLPQLHAGAPADTCRSYLAYAQAKEGYLLEARAHLATLTQNNSEVPSDYWNLACCIPADEEQTTHRIEVLAAGLQRAPHPHILNALIYLGLLSEDTRISEWLRLLPFTESLLLSFHYDFDELDYAIRERALARLNTYVRRGEPRIPDPSLGTLYGSEARRYREAVNDYLDTLLELHQPQVFEFWLSCREMFAWHRYEFWESKVDFLKRAGRMEEAAKAFADEVQRRVGFMQRVPRQVFPWFIRDTRERAREWLLHCMIPELKEVGQRVYRTLKMQAGASEQFKDILPNDRRIQTFYAETSPPPPQPQPPGGGNPGTVRQPSLLPTTDIAGLFAIVSAECQNTLHEVSQVPAVEPRLDQLKSTLAARNYIRAAATLGEVVDIWLHRGNGKQVDAEDPQAWLQTSEEAVARLRTEFERELAPDSHVFANQLIRTFERVNQHFARDTQLLPKLLIEPATGDVVTMDTSLAPTAFAIRVRTANGSRPTRLVGATAVLETEQTTFLLRDKLDEVKTEVGPDQNALLTFASAHPTTFPTGSEVRVQVTYDFSGRAFTTRPISLRLEHQSCPALPSSSPYIFSRALDANEIDGHFFGRSDEQRLILEAIREGQQRLHYIEGIRRAGKSSLLHSIEYEIIRQQLPLIAVYVQAASVAASEDAGRILFNFLYTVANDRRLREAGITAPSEEGCRSNLKRAYTEFLTEIESKLPETRVVILLDDFQVVVETGDTARKTGSTLLFQGILGLLNLLYENASPRARLLWVFAGQRTFSQFKSMVPGALLWGTLQVMSIDFLDRAAVAEILRRPLDGTAISIPDETAATVHRHTGGHPEVVQQVAEQMLDSARRESRWILTPADADQAARDVADLSDNFATTWYPVGELKPEQKQLIAAFFNAVPQCGGSIEPFKLVAGGEADPIWKAIDDLVARKILTRSEDGSIQVKAFVLERWLRRFVRSGSDGGPGFGVHGSVAIFIDVANLTSGSGAGWLDRLQTNKGEDGVPGRFSLATVLTVIEKWATALSPAPIVARWVVNYPLKAPAVVECNAKGYQVENIPEELIRKGDGSDDVTLREKIAEIEQWYPVANHFVIVTGDKDYCLTAGRLLRNGRFVHFAYRAGSLSADVNSRYQVLARQFPERFTLTELERLLEA